MSNVPGSRYETPGGGGWSGGREIGPVLKHLWLPNGVHVLHNHIRFISHTGRLSGRIYEILLLNQIFTFILLFPVIIVLYLNFVLLSIIHLRYTHQGKKQYYNKYTEKKLFLVDFTNKLNFGIQ